MGTAAKLDLEATETTREETFEEMEERLLAGAEERIHADVADAMRLGLIDEHGNLLFDDLPEDMQPGAQRDFGG